MKKSKRMNITCTVSTYVEPEDTREEINIVELNAEIRRIVSKEEVLRRQIDDIIVEIEGEEYNAS